MMSNYMPLIYKGTKLFNRQFNIFHHLTNN